MNTEEAKQQFGLLQTGLNVISGVVAGYSDKEIGEHFNLGESTVKYFLFTSYQKLGVSSREELRRFAIDHELPLSKLPPKP